MTDSTDRNAARAISGAQYTLPFISTQNSSKATRLISSPANEEAVKLLERWRDDVEQREGQGILVTGPPSSGKSFLTTRVMTGKQPLHLSITQVEAILTDWPEETLIIVDDVDMMSDPTLLVRFVDGCRERGSSFVLIGQGKPENWARTEHGPLIDLVTRLSALPEATIDSPDPELMTQILDSWMRARQIILPSELTTVAVKGLKRSFASLATFAQQLDAEAMQRQKSIDKAMIQSVQDRLPEHTLS